MGLKLQWLVLKQWRLPAKWKPALTILALIAPDKKKDGTDGDGSGIFVKEEDLRWLPRRASSHSQ